jgi:hypothetical protein
VSTVGASERATQKRVIKLFTDELGYAYLGDWHHSFPFFSGIQPDPRAGLDEKLDEKLGSTRARIVQLMRAHPTVTVTKLAAELRLSRNAIDKNVQILKKNGVIERIGPARGGHWEVLT